MVKNPPSLRRRAIAGAIGARSFARSSAALNVSGRTPSATMMMTGTSIHLESQFARGADEAALRKGRTDTHADARILLANAPPSPIDLSGIVTACADLSCARHVTSAFECHPETRVTGRLGKIGGESREQGESHRAPRLASAPIHSSSPRPRSRRRRTYRSARRRGTAPRDARHRRSVPEVARRERRASSTTRFGASSARSPRTRSSCKRPPKQPTSRGPIRGA